MAFSKRIDMLPLYQPGKEQELRGFARASSKSGYRIADLALQIPTNIACYLWATLGNICNCCTDKATQKTLNALVPIAGSSRISQRITQVLYPELDAIWPALDQFSNLMRLQITELEKILSPHFDADFATSAHGNRCDETTRALQPQNRLTHRVIQMLRVMLMATVKSCGFRMSTIFHLQCASVYSAIPSCKMLADQRLQCGLRAAAITHTSSAQSIAAAGLVLFPTGAKGGIIALLHMQEKIIEKLNSPDFIKERRLAHTALQRFYIARATAILMVLLEQLHKVKKSLIKIRFPSINASLAKIWRAADQIIELIKSLYARWTQTRAEIKCSDQQPLQERVQHQVQKGLLSPREDLERQIRENTLEVLESLISPIKWAGEEKISHLNDKSTSQARSQLPFKRSRSCNSLAEDRENKRPCRQPRALKISPLKKHFSSDDALKNRAHILTASPKQLDF